MTPPSHATVEKIAHIVLPNDVDDRSQNENEQSFIQKFHKHWTHKHLPLSQFLTTMAHHSMTHTAPIYSTLLQSFALGYNTLSRAKQVLLAIHINKISRDDRVKHHPFFMKGLRFIQHHTDNVSSLPMSISFNTMIQYSSLGYRALFQAEKFKFMKQFMDFPIEMDVEYEVSYRIAPYQCFDRFLLCAWVFFGSQITADLLSKTSSYATPHPSTRSIPFGGHTPKKKKSLFDIISI